MRLYSRSIPWISISIPWNRRSIPWQFRSKATFQRKNSPETCHIVAKIAFWGVHAVMRRTDVLYYQTFLIFAYLRATAQPCENIRFSVLKKRGWGGLLSLWGKGGAACRRACGHVEGEAVGGMAGVCFRGAAYGSAGAAFGPGPDVRAKKMGYRCIPTLLTLNLIL